MKIEGNLITLTIEELKSFAVFLKDEIEFLQEGMDVVTGEYIDLSSTTTKWLEWNGDIIET